MLLKRSVLQNDDDDLGVINCLSKFLGFYLSFIPLYTGGNPFYKMIR